MYTNSTGRAAGMGILRGTTGGEFAYKITEGLNLNN